MSERSGYRCAIVGVGGNRARGHADAYTQISGGELVAISTRNREALDDFGSAYAISARYTDYREMFAKERLDVVHVNTPPDVRLEIFEAAEEAGIPALIVEKPLAIEWEDLQAIEAFARRARIKIAVNHQLHFHPRRLWLAKLVKSGALGTIEWIDASSGLNMAYQGTHTLQAVGAFTSQAPVASVFAQVAGAEGLMPNVRRHYAPDACQALVTYDDGVQALLRCGRNAPEVVPGGGAHMHKRIQIFGTRGLAEWTMWSWRTVIDGREELGEHVYADEDLLGQAAMTEAMFAWLADDAAVHPLNLANSIADFVTLLLIYQAGVDRRIVHAPGEPKADLIEHMRRVLQGSVDD